MISPVTAPGGAATENPLADHYTRAGRPLPDLRLVPGDSLPPVERRLLVHDRDMTSTLEEFHGGAIHIEPLHRELDGEVYRREVVLVVTATGRPAEFGAIRIFLNRLPPAARTEIIAARRPFGGILNAAGIRYVSRPNAFFAVTADDFIGRALRVPPGRLLHGRRNTLRSPDGAVLAEIVEILPPPA